MNENTQRMIIECKRQEESCLYTSTELFEWLKYMRCLRVWLIVIPICLGGIATIPLLTEQSGYGWLTSICALLAGIAPAIYRALDFDVNLDQIAKQAHQYKILQDRFRQAWFVTATENIDVFSSDFNDLMEKMDAARSASLTPPERFFKRAKSKIEAGHYDFAIDKESPN